MTKKKTLLLCASLAGAVVAILLAVAFLLPAAKVDWPQFPQPASAEPQVVVEVEPDFAYHIGDVVPVDIYVRQPAGTAVDVGSLALEGDFEVRGEPTVTRVSQADGAEYIRIRINLQSFAPFKPTYESKLNITFEKPGDRMSHPIATPPITVGASNTWDGRKVIQEGKLDPWFGSHLAWTIGYLVVAVGGFIGLSVWIRRIRRLLPIPAKPRVPLTPRQVAKARFDKAWTKIRAGDQSERNFRVIDVVVRQLERIEHVVLEYVPIAIGDHHPRRAQIMYILEQCEDVIYRGSTLTNEQLDMLEAAFSIYVGAAPLEPEPKPES